MLTNAAKGLGVQPQFVTSAERAQDLESAFATMSAGGAEALYVDLNPRTSNMGQAIVDLATQRSEPRARGAAPASRSGGGHAA